MKKILFLIPVLFLAAYCAQAQPINVSTPEAMKRSAEEAEADNNPYAALELYEKVFAQTKDKELLVKIAKLNYDLRDYEDAEKKYARLVTRDRKKEYVNLKYWYAMCLKYNEKYDDAIEQFKAFQEEGSDEALKASVKNEIEGCQMAKKMKQPDNLLVNNAGKKVNFPQTDASPSVSDGELYFTSMREKDVVVLDGKEGEFHQKIYVASKSGAEFAEPAALGVQINREGYHQGNVAITPDGKTMFFTRVQLNNNVVSESKIFYSKMGTDGWGAANEVTGVNGEYIAKHPAVGELFGEQVLFFVANIPGGKGGDDIYYATRKSEGVYGAPVNLGDVINTPGNEATPYYRDGKLFFSSDGQITMGGMDVFESQWNGTVWSAPKALNKGINSSVDDMYYSQSADGMMGYVVSNRPGPNNLKSKTCCDDIYAWEIERVKVNLTATTFRFKKKGEKENPALTGCQVQVFDVTDKNPSNTDTKSNAAANDFTFDLLPEKSYMVIAFHEGFHPDTVKFNTVGVKKTIAIDKKLTLRPLPPPKPVEPKLDTVVVKINEPIRLNSILYDFDDDKILPEAEKDLTTLYDLMVKYPDMKIELSSHTDAQGNDNYNQRLSQRRATSAKNWLLAKGIASDRINAVGYGETQILNQCTNGVQCTDEEHRYNRRTEFKITAGPTTITMERIEVKKAPEPEPKKDKKGGKQSVRPDFFFQGQ